MILKPILKLKLQPIVMLPGHQDISLWLGWIWYVHMQLPKNKNTKQMQKYTLTIKYKKTIRFKDDS